MELGIKKEQIISLPENTGNKVSNFGFEKKNPYQENLTERHNNLVEAATQAVVVQQGQQQVIVSPQRIREDKIEKVLAKDLEKFYDAMSQRQQAEFKMKGEVTAREINKILEGAKVNVNKILKLVKAWLMIIPGVNMFFIEQETKIKTDEIMRLK